MAALTRTPVVLLLFAIALLFVALLSGAARAGAAGPKAPAAFAAGPNDGLTRALERGEITPAKYALERARSLFELARLTRAYGDVDKPDPHATTLLLRDLSLRVEQLAGRDRERADALLARPTEGASDPDGLGYVVPEARPLCGAHVCIHYVKSSYDKVSATDANKNGISDYVERALRVFDKEVWGKEIGGMGYRSPKSDISSYENGASAADPSGSKFDVYLSDVGYYHLYGFCTSDDPNLDDPYYPYWDMSAYCVVDNDFSSSQFGNRHTPSQNLRVTAAHEFFHAVQFAYDITEDSWLMEGTAVWMEDEVYDSINDNLQFLANSPLTHPSRPLDTSAYPHHYGAWIFFRFLSEWFDPSVVKSIWLRADSRAGGPDAYSTQAVEQVALARGTNYTRLFAAFGRLNRISHAWYDEGRAHDYPQAPLSEYAITWSASLASITRAPKLNHQTNRYYEFKRGSGISSSQRLRFILNLPYSATRAAASALVFSTSGAISEYRFQLNSSGDGTFSVPFGTGIAKVDLVLTNGSTRYTCWYSSDSPYSCRGLPWDDAATFNFRAQLG